MAKRKATGKQSKDAAATVRQVISSGGSVHSHRLTRAWQWSLDQDGRPEGSMVPAGFRGRVPSYRYGTATCELKLLRRLPWQASDMESNVRIEWPFPRHSLGEGQGSRQLEGARQLERSTEGQFCGEGPPKTLKLEQLQTYFRWTWS